jgi:uncharacterized phiE125 gp8 family phage protein
MAGFYQEPGADRSRPYFSFSRIAGPDAEPVLVTELKRHCHVEHTDEDELLAAYLGAAREWVEARLNRCLIDTRWEMELDRFPPGGVLRLRKPFTPTPDKQEIEIEYLDGSLRWRQMQEVQPSLAPQAGTFIAYRKSVPAVITPNVAGNWPVTGAPRAAVKVRWWSGYGDGASAVPRGVRNAMMMLGAHWYLNREAVGNVGNSIPLGVTELLASHTWGCYS